MARVGNMQGTTDDDAALSQMCLAEAEDLYSIISSMELARWKSAEARASVQFKTNNPVATPTEGRALLPLVLLIDLPVGWGISPPPPTPQHTNRPNLRPCGNATHTRTHA